MMGEETVNPRGDLVACRSRQLLVGQQHRSGLQWLLTRDDRGDRSANPAQRPVRSQGKVAVRGSGEALGAIVELCRQGFLCSGLHGICIGSIDLAVRGETESIQTSNMVPFDNNVPGRANFGF